MASTKLMTTKDGKKFYRIQVSRGYGVTPYTTRWYVPDGWSQKTIDRELLKVSRDFERQCENGEIKSRSEVKAEKKAKELEDAKIKTFKQYGESVFMPIKSAYYSEKSRSDFQSKLNLHVYPVIGDYKLEEITSAQITALIVGLQTRLKHASVIKIYEIINLVFKMAYLDDTIERNPMDKVERPKAKKEEGKDTTIKAFTEKEMEYIIKCVDKEPLKWRTYLWLLIDTGCRRGEISGLKWHSIDLEHGMITIENNLCYTTEKGVYDDTPKSGKRRTIYIDESIVSMLKEMKASQEDLPKVIKMNEKNDGGYVFTQEHSHLPMHPTSVTHYMRQFGKRYGIMDFHPHKLRHTWASITIKNGGDIASVSEKLGHSDKAVTLRMYTHADEESQKRASDVFRKALNNINISQG